MAIQIIGQLPVELFDKLSSQVSEMSTTRQIPRKEMRSASSF
jgi:hypothetical protein